MSESHAELPPIKVGFVIDNVLVDVLHTDERLAAIFLSSPTILDLTGIPEIPAVGSTYDPENNSFTAENFFDDDTSE